MKAQNHYNTIPRYHHYVVIAGESIWFWWCSGCNGALSRLGQGRSKGARRIPMSYSKDQYHLRNIARRWAIQKWMESLLAVNIEEHDLEGDVLQWPS